MRDQKKKKRETLTIAKELASMGGTLKRMSGLLPFNAEKKKKKKLVYLRKAPRVGPDFFFAFSQMSF